MRSEFVTLIVGLVPVILAGIAGYGARRANQRASDLERDKADTKMIDRVQLGYRTLLESLEARIKGLEADLDLVRTMLTEERTANDLLRQRMRELQAQISDAQQHRRIIRVLYGQLQAAGLTPAIVLGPDIVGEPT